MSTKRRLFEETDDLQVIIEKVIRANPGIIQGDIAVLTGINPDTISRVLRSFLKFGMAYHILLDEYIPTPFGGRTNKTWYMKEY